MATITRDHLKQLLDTAMKSYNTHNDTTNRLVKHIEYLKSIIVDREESIVGYRFQIEELRNQLNECGNKLRDKYDEKRNVRRAALEKVFTDERTDN